MKAFDRFERIQSISFAENASRLLPTGTGNLPNDRFMWGLRLTFSGRATNPAANNPTGSLADDVFNILNRVTVRGFHKPRRVQETFIDLRGPEIAVLNRIFASMAPYSIPANLDLGANNTNDIRFMLDIPFVPLGCSPHEQAMYLLDAPNYESLQLQVQFGDTKSIFSGQTTEPAWTAYGSAAGTPELVVSGMFALGGAQQFRNFVPARVFRTFNEITGSDITTTANGVRLFDVPKGYKIRGLLIKSGVKATVSAGNDAYTSLSNDYLTNLKLNLGLNRFIRWYPSMYELQADTLNNYAVQLPAGYGWLDFAGKTGLDFSLATAGLVGGANGDTDLYLQADVAGAASRAALFVTEELRYAAGVQRTARR